MHANGEKYVKASSVHMLVVRETGEEMAKWSSHIVILAGRISKVLTSNVCPILPKPRVSGGSPCSGCADIYQLLAE